MVTFINQAEEFPADFTLHEVPRHGAPAGVAPAAETEPADTLRVARCWLRPGELHHYEALCPDTTEALTRVLPHVTPRQTEGDIAASLDGQLAAAADPLVLLANGAPAQASATPFLGGRPATTRHGGGVRTPRRHDCQRARWVRFNGGTLAELDAKAHIAAIGADIFDATVPGETVAEVLAEIRTTSYRHGFGPVPGRLPHLGGPAGYAGRDPLATDAVRYSAVVHQPFT